MLAQAAQRGCEVPLYIQNLSRHCHGQHALVGPALSGGLCDLQRFLTISGILCFSVPWDSSEVQPGKTLANLLYVCYYITLLSSYKCEQQNSCS